MRYDYRAAVEIYAGSNGRLVSTTCDTLVAGNREQPQGSLI